MMIKLKERSKGKKNLRWNCVPLEDQKNSGIPTIRWIIWILYYRCGLDKQEGGFLFDRYNRRKARIGNYDPMFRNLTE